ncbi:helix-hairpin-helix domain-containing protein, partial [Streptomyces sp. NPDC006197]|uniref:helix-hairpin-helix domain-containing protein n=1 Tax=Streptomyces sp. NPDC006197 TaxID=3156685 RepID=UPI0033AC6584
MTDPSGETAPEAAEPTEDLREEAAETPAPDAAEGPESAEEPAGGPGTTEEPGTDGEPGAPEGPGTAEGPVTAEGRDSAEGPEAGEGPGNRAATPEGPEAAEEPDNRTATAEEPDSAEESGDRAALGEEPESAEEPGDRVAVAEEAGGAEGAGASEVSEAQAELAAQRELRARIEARKAEKSGPLASGAKLSGTAADLLAAVRAVEGGTASGSAFYEAPEPAPRRPAVETAPATTVRPPAPERPAAPAPGTTAAVREVLAAGGAPEALADRVAAVLGEGAAPALREDPWQLLAVPGVRPEQADGFARALLGPACGPGDPRRAVALTVWLLERAAVQGHTALEVQAVCAGLAGHAVPDPEQAVEAAVSEGAVLLFQEEETAEEPDGDEEVEEASAPAAEREPAAPVLLGLDRYALAEESLADGLARLVRTAKADVWEGGELERAAGAHGLVLHTGGEAARAEVRDDRGQGGADDRLVEGGEE